MNTEEFKIMRIMTSFQKSSAITKELGWFGTTEIL